MADIVMPEAGIDFVSERCMKVAQRLLHSDEYEVVNNKLQATAKRLEGFLETEEQHRIFMELSDYRTELACMTEAACYLQGFHDVLRLEKAREKPQML